MTRLKWNELSSRQIETGVDRGVLYLNGVRAYSFTEMEIPNFSGISATITEPLADGITATTLVFSFTFPLTRTFSVGNRVRISNSDANYIDAIVTSSRSNSITVEVVGVGGSGTFSQWTIIERGRAVAWNGLTSVEEKGGSQVVSYYMDGQAYLHYATPKDYAATISAYTFPDEFSEVLGVIEAADGMYLDSQIGDSFGFSYRTLVADPINGTNAGYKIHLVYNATIVPSSKNYQSINASVNPVDFSWDIQAVPVGLPGYRATAHFIIDSRQADQNLLNRLEAQLYGTGNTNGYLPEASDVFDMLSFGDTIIITDRGDGIWTAEGSSANIYMVGDGIFEITNVNAIVHGDGTYTISTTNA